MKLNNILYLTTISLLLYHPTIFAAAELLTYKNARGSVLTVQFNPENTVTGSFTTAVATKECQQAIGMKRPIIGFIAKNAIAFSVNYPECGSVVTFIGNMEKNKSIIDTTALLVHNSVQAAKEGPGSRMISHDVFNRM